MANVNDNGDGHQHEHEDEESLNMGMGDRTLRFVLRPTRAATGSCIVLPADAITFSPRPAIFQSLPTFHGLDKENPYTHIRDFENMSLTCQEGKCSNESIFLKLFPFSLKDKAKNWFNALPPHSITTWLALQTIFLKKFFSVHMTQGLKRQIVNFAQKEDETFDATWERFKELLLACPHHGFDEIRLIGFFYDGLSSSKKQFVETMCNGEFLDKTSEEAWTFLETIAESAQSWDTTSEFDRTTSTPTQAKQAGVIAVPPDEALEAKLEAIVHRRLEALKMKEVKATTEVACLLCSSTDHGVDVCPGIPIAKQVLMDPTQVNYVSNQTQGTSNSNWRSNPNLSWGSQKQQQSTIPPYRPPFLAALQGNQQGKSDAGTQQVQSLNDTLNQFIQMQMAQNQANFQNWQQVQQAQAQAQVFQQQQFAQMSENLAKLQANADKGKLPSQPTPNPNVNATPQASNAKPCQAVTTLRSGRELVRPEPPQVEVDVEGAKENEATPNEEVHEEEVIPDFEEVLLEEPLVGKRGFRTPPLLRKYLAQRSREQQMKQPGSNTNGEHQSTKKK